MVALPWPVAAWTGNMSCGTNSKLHPFEGPSKKDYSIWGTGVPYLGKLPFEQKAA